MRRSGGAAAARRSRGILDDLAVELLPPQSYASVTRKHAPGNVGARLNALAWVVTEEGSQISRFSKAVGRGVVVISCRGWLPSCIPNYSMSNVASAYRHFTISSDQTQENCGTRKPPGSSAENACATAPFFHSSRLRDRSQTGRSCCACTASRPETASTVTSRTSC
jgi:hypothetical protein